jgi:membrane protein implicated in regulation of membrane protease activity
MTEFMRAAVDSPAVLFGVLLILVLLYWLLVALGVLDVVIGLVAAVAISLFVLLAWFAGLTGTVLVAAIIISGLLTRLLMRPLRRMLTEEQVPTRQDFVGRMCVIRTGRVDLAFGQAEVRAADGSAAVIPVRQQRNREEEATLKAGSTALIFDYDADGEFFWVMPYDAELDPHRPPR